MQDFARLLKGVTPISKARVTDAQTSRTHAVFGVSMPRYHNDNAEVSYWAMLLFVNPDRITSKSTLSRDEIMQTMSSSGTAFFGIDPESGQIVSSSAKAYIGKDIEDLGFPEEALSDQFRGFFWVDDVRMYGMSAKLDGVLYYYFFSQQHLYRHVFQNTVRGALTYLVLIIVLAVYLLRDYKKVYDDYADKGEALRESDSTVMIAPGEFKYSTDPSRRWSLNETTYGRYTPFYNAVGVGEAVFMLSVILIAVFYTQGGLFGSNTSAIAYILSGRWSKGFNLFAITNILFLCVGISAVTIFCKFMIAIVTRFAGTKGETIGKLLMDLLRYLGLIVFAYYALSYVGVNTAALVASLGIISFAVSLGAQDLIKDILAGMSIVIDGEYQVGDIIEVGGFRGTVLEVGVRSTKIEGRGGNILIMGNRDVKNVINKTRKNSWYPLDINISESENLTQVEALLREKLPQIGSGIPEIISGPFYKGVVNLGRGTLCLNIIAECLEPNYHKVQRQLNGAVALLLEENGISIK